MTMREKKSPLETLKKTIAGMREAVRNADRPYAIAIFHETVTIWANDLEKLAPALVPPPETQEPAVLEDMRYWLEHLRTVGGMLPYYKLKEWIAAIEQPIVAPETQEPRAEQPTEETTMTYYGPHDCEHCGHTIVKAAREDGGAAFDVPSHLLRIFQRGSEAGNVDVAYPVVWVPHVCQPSDRPNAHVQEDPPRLGSW